MNYRIPLLRIQSEQFKNPLHRYKKVREFYAEAINDNCVFHNLYSFPSENNDPLSEPFPKSLLPKYYGGHGLIDSLMSHQYYSVIPISFELALEICKRHKVAESSLQKAFSWDHFYSVCPTITSPLSTLEQINKAWNEEWIKFTPEWWHQAVAELNDPRNL